MQKIRRTWSHARAWFNSLKIQRWAPWMTALLLLVMIFGYQNCSNNFQTLQGSTSFNSLSADGTVIGACVSGTTQTCAINNGVGVQTCNAEGSAFAACEIATCNPAFSFQNGQCVAKSCTPGTSTACSANNGMGTQVCNQEGTGPGACMLTSCNAGYRLANGQCTKIPATTYYFDDAGRDETRSQAMMFAVREGALLSQNISSADPNGTPLVLGKVEIAAGVTAFSARFGAKCAVVNGALKCWGRNFDCKMGPPAAPESWIASPTTLIPSGVTDVALGLRHTCAIVNGSLQCIGSNYHGELGTGSTSVTSECSFKTVIPSGVTAVSAGFWQTCAIVNGSALCWGNMNAGTQSPESAGQNVESATPVTFAQSGVQKIFAGSFSNGARLSNSCFVVNGALQCWGNNYAAQIGNGTRTFQPTPTTIIASGVTDVKSGQLHTCALVNTAMKCWGVQSGWTNGLNLNSTDFILSPISVIESGVLQLAAGVSNDCAVMANTVKCWWPEGIVDPNIPRTLPTTYNIQ